MRRSILPAAVVAALVVLLRKLLEDVDSRASSAVAPAGRESRETTGLGDLNQRQLYELAKELEIPGRSKMSKDELARAVAESKGDGGKT